MKPFKLPAAYITAFFLFFSLESNGQNLVLNNSFEQKQDSIRLENWSIFPKNSGNVFSKYSPDINFSTPRNLYGYQMPKEGDNYLGMKLHDIWHNAKMGMITKQITVTAQTKLKNSLSPGKLYKIQLNVSLGDKSFVAVNQIGCYITRNSSLSGLPIHPTVQLQLRNGVPISSREKWIELNGYYLAKGGEAFLTIGFNKFEDYKYKVIDWGLYHENEVLLLLADKKTYSKPFHQSAYYYIDAISFAPVKDFGYPFNEYFVIDNLLFATGSATVNATGQSELKNLYSLLNNNPGLRLKLRGHTDTDGGDEYNFELSVSRSQSIKTHLIGKGIQANRIKIEGEGEKDPIASNVTYRGKQLNRRVEVYIWTPR